MSKQWVDQDITYLLVYIEGRTKWVSELESQKSKAEEIL
jgi:hypothetical protein